MSSLHQLLQNHIEYDAWATGRLLDAAQGLAPEQLNHDFGTADKSITGTLVHLVRSARTWLQRIENEKPGVPLSVPDHEDWPALRAEWAVVQQGWKEWADALADGDELRVLEYSDLKGRPWAQPLWEVVLHVVNHGTHHRGQVAGFLRASGVIPPPLDYIAYVRQRSK